MRVLDYIREIDFSPRVAVVLGSGLGNFVERMKVVGVLPYTKVDDMPHSTVQGHAGRFIMGYVGDVPVVAMQGRIHYYEGYNIKLVVSPIVMLRECGVRRIILTNAAGGINRQFGEGNLMLIKDHIMMVPNPLIGVNNEGLGERFPDMSDIYDAEFRCKIKQAAIKAGITLAEGTYLQLSGPSYETPAEIRMWGMLGVDAVGMSTACEALMANYLGLEVIGVSCITNMAAGINQRLCHADVTATSHSVADVFGRLLELIVSI